MRRKINTYKADYRNKIIYWTNQLNESLNCAPIDKSTKRMYKALESLNYFANKQIEIERMDEQVNEMIELENDNARAILNAEKEAFPCPKKDREQSLKEWMSKNEKEFGIKIINKDEFPE